MASSDDELESLPHSVSDFHFEDEGREPTSLSVLPLYWSEDEFSDGERKEIFLSGVADDGLQKIYKPVSAWKFNLSEHMPQIFVLFKGNNWIKLQKPRKGYAEEIRAILITISALHYLKNNPEASQVHLWDHLAKTFSTYEAGPSQDDLEDQLSLINESVKRDETLRKSKFLLSFLEERPQKRKAASKVAEISTKRAFIVDDDEMDVADDASDEEDDLFGSICAICDNGGELVCCDGQCMRSFHATIEAGAESSCRSLRFSDAQVKVMQSFICRNCKYNQHQCFCCGKLGSSDKASGAEVFRCVNATCGLFYHPRCVAKVLHANAAAAEETRQKIAAGESFTCPIHRCCVCQKLEDKNVSELQFAVCRRCPKSYHRKCLPSDISFEDEEDDDIIQRAWEGLMPKRILIYCLEHEIDEDLGTPVRDHVKFPPIQKNQASRSLFGTESFRSRKGSPDVDEIASDKTFRKPFGQIEKPSSMMERAESFKRDKRRSAPTALNKIMRNDPSMKSLHVDIKHAGKKVKSSTTEESGTSLGEQLYNFWREGSEAGKPRKLDTAAAASNKTIATMPVKETLTSVLQLDKDSERRILDLMKQSTSSVSLEDVIKKHRIPSTHGSRNNVDRTITQGKIEGSVEAVRAAVQKLEKGRNIEDAKAVCEPEILQQIIRWKNKLKVYLAPFIHGMRYTSFGRHFTKVDKLKEIVDRLHWYAQPGDMIVDFCCGSNDFSCLMRNKLEETGKKCFYKNFDLLQPKHDFNFVKKDWMTVQPKELLVGSKLIMGLNPPFGLKACLANQFINKALEFKPKLIILIVPPETERLDNKRSPYVLVWEDNAKLSGKSFYLPGSVDVHDKQIEQWNATPPVLSLWSRPDWSNKHIAIAREHDHLPRLQMEPSQLEEPPKGSPSLTLEDSRGRHRDSPIPTVNQHIQIDDPIPDGSGAIASSDKDKDKEIRPYKNENKGESDRSSGPKNMSNKSRRQKRKERGRVESDSSVPDNPSGMKRLRPDLPSPGKSDSRSTPMFNVSRSGSPEKLKPKSPRVEYEEGFEHFQPSIQGYAEVSARSPDEEERFAHFQPGVRGYGEVIARSPDDLVRRYGSNTREHYTSGMLGRSDPIGFRPYTMGDHSNILGQARHYGQQDSGSFSHIRSVSSYGRLGSSGEPHYMPTIHGYAPQLDELNRSRLNVPALQLPKEPRGGNYYDPLVPPPRFGAGAHHPFPYSG